MSDEDFVELCISGGTVKVEEAIINGANVNAKDKDDTKRMESLYFMFSLGLEETPGLSF